ncbi:MAG: glutamate--cysteine ligase [Deltaproteobacteria bacterium]|nr:glutamate--cysteine ligase [Deltaproteobacteria bacterium]
MNLNRDILIETFQSYGTPRHNWRVGGEFERAVVRPNGAPIGYHEPDGIRWILEQLAKDASWTTVFEDENPIALHREDMANITLEPGGQVELSGAPHKTLTDLAEEMMANRTALLDISADKEHVWIANGLTPITPIAAIPWVPKGRYRIMQKYLPQRGDLAAYMMKGTCSVQANFDYSSETDCARKVRLCSGLSPLTTALFANSPLLENRPTGFKSYRGHIWTRTDPDRTGFPPALRSAYSHERWVDYLLDAPMMFRLVGDQWVFAHGVPFRRFMDEGIDGHFPTMEDWKLHQTSVFPEVRIKHTIEVRGADCVDHTMALAFCALFTGLLYCNTALDEGLALVTELEGYQTHKERFDLACKDGLDAEIGGRTLADWASDLGEIANRGLHACLPDDTDKITTLLERIEQGRTPADDLLAAWQTDPSPENIIRSIAY